MFDISLNQMKASVWVDEREVSVAFQHAALDLTQGFNVVMWADAEQIARKIDRALISGVPYKTNIRRLKVLRDSFIMAFGPEGEAAYTSQS